MGTIAEGVTSLLEGREPAPRPSNIFSFLAYAALFGLLVLQARAIVRSVRALRNGRCEPAGSARAGGSESRWC